MQVARVGVVYKATTTPEYKLEAVASGFSRHGVHVTMLPTTATPGSATSLAAYAASTAIRADVVIAMGGDGTVHQVVEGLVGTGIPVVIIPGGTGNLFGRSFFAVPKNAAQFSTFIKSLIAAVLRAQAQPIDLVQFNCVDAKGVSHQGFFMVALGFGDVSDAIIESAPGLKAKLGSFAYALNIAAKLPSFRSLKTTLISGTQEQSEDLVMSSVFNVVPPKMAALSRGCNASDGLMDFVGLRGRGVGHLIAGGTNTAFGRPDLSERYLRMRVKQLKIKTDRPMKLDLDGDPGPITSEVELSVLNGAVQMILA